MRLKVTKSRRFKESTNVATNTQQIAGRELTFELVQAVIRDADVVQDANVFLRKYLLKQAEETVTNNSLQFYNYEQQQLKSRRGNSPSP